MQIPRLIPGLTRAALLADAAWRLGPRPVGHWLRHRIGRTLRGGLGQAAMPEGPFLGGLPRAEGATPLPDWHGPFDPDAPAGELDLFAPGDIRPVWEANRFNDLLVLAQDAALDPALRGRAEARIAAWCAANPPFRGPAWACGQEAALRGLNLCLALALLETDRDPPPGARVLLALLARRIAATRAYARAQDNTHPLSEAAGLFALSTLLGQGRAAAEAAGELARLSARLIGPDGGFAACSPGYARLALDTLSVAEWLRCRHGAPPFAPVVADRAAALGGWLHRLTDPATGAAPRLGVEDDSALADLSRAGPRDARPSLERAARLFTGRSAGWPGDPGCAWLGLPVPGGAAWTRPAAWRAGGVMGWEADGLSALLRTGPLRFRPFQADLLHLSLSAGGVALIRDGGTGSYNPPEPWWWDALAGAAGHNGAVFDGAEPMPRAGRFLLARWPRLRPIPGGAALRDARGNRQARRVTLEGGACLVEDLVAGPFRSLAFHWRLAPADWRLRPDGAASPLARITVEADAPLRLRLAQGWESPAYGAIAPVPQLVVEASAPVGRVVTRIVA